MAEKLLIRGAVPHSPSGTPFPRLEIRQFVAQENIKQFSLYIQALSNIYAKPATDRAGLYQLGGIHGMPYVDWNEAPANGDKFCVHNTIRFSSWHRGITVLFEQEVQKVAIQIAETYPEGQRTEWRSAAESLRQPYWGWDQEATFIPPDELIRSATVEIIAPSGNRQSVSNPLLGYPFRTGETTIFPPPFNSDTRTVRNPDTNRISQPDILLAGLRARKNDIIGLTRLIYSITDFATFNNRLENDAHSRIHTAVGGIGGHMSTVEVSGFDIAFFFLHSQIDRILTRWHSIHGGWPSGEDGRNGLAPFWRDNNGYWPPVDISDTRTFSYSYYSTTVLIPSAEEDFYEWVVRIKTNPFEVGGSFSVLLFFGDVPAELPQTAEWLTHPTFAGVFDVFSNSNPDECANCKEHRDTIIDGLVLLNKPLVEKAKLASLEENVVEQFLTGKLNWAIQKGIDGTRVGLNDVPSLEVTVERKTFTLPAGAEYPTEGKPKFYHDITRGKPGGYYGTD